MPAWITWCEPLTAQKYESKALDGHDCHLVGLYKYVSVCLCVCVCVCVHAMCDFHVVCHAMPEWAT